MTVSERTTAVDELHRQVEVLVDKRYPDLAGLTDDDFRALAAPLADRLPPEPFVLVVTGAVASPAGMVERTVLTGKPGFTTVEPDDLARFTPIADVAVPDSPVHVITRVDTGGQYRNVRPDDALPSILEGGRSPLTLEEGIAVATQHPEWLRERNCFQMPGSRAGDKRVTGVWLSKGRPRLGWCWGGNPHSWLGMGSAARRVG